MAFYRVVGCHIPRSVWCRGGQYSEAMFSYTAQVIRIAKTLKWIEIIYSEKNIGK